MLTGQGGDLLTTQEPWHVPRLITSGRWLTAAHDVLVTRRMLGAWPPIYLRSWARARVFRVPSQDGRRYCPDWINPEIVRTLDLESQWTQANSLPRPDPTQPRPHFQRFSDPEYWQTVAEFEDPANVGFPALASHPLLDVRLLAYARDIAPLPWCANKQILREAMKGDLPDRLRLRPKTLPDPRILAPPLGAHEEDLLASSWLVREGFIMRGRFIALSNSYRQGERTYSARAAVSRVLGFERWYEAAMRPE